MRFTPLLSALLATSLIAPAAAQEAEPDAGPLAEDAEAPEDEAEAEAALEGEEIVVTGTRRGAVAGDIPPEITLDARDIRAYGASNLSELLEALGPQTGSARGRGGGQPVVLLNGRRISGFREIANLPPEAIERVDILPEEVALKYGYPAEQRVVNFVLRPRFRAVTAEAETTLATAGGHQRYEADLNVLRISNDGRWEVDAEFNRSGALLESERDIIGIETGPADPLVPSLTPFRTLVGPSEQLQLSGTISRTLFTDIAATLTGRYEATRTESLFGLPSANLVVPAQSPFARTGSDETVFRYFDIGHPLSRDGDNRNASLGLALNGAIQPWNWSVTANWDRATSDSRTDRGVDAILLQERIAAGDPDIDPFGPLTAELLTARPSDRARTVNGSANAELVMTG
ncbi:MAG: TonB-dependent receptor plug domain-containing protein, partial [Allosphingosinicella sp.]